MEDKERIEEECAQKGYTVREWRDDPNDGITAVLGRFVVGIEDEHEGLYEGDEGELIAQVVGAAQYHNQRVCFTFIPDEMDVDGGNEVTDLNSLDPA